MCFYVSLLKAGWGGGVKSRGLSFLFLSVHPSHNFTLTISSELLMVEL